MPVQLLREVHVVCPSPKRKIGHRKNVSDTVSAACPSCVGVGNVSNTWTWHSSEVSVFPSLEAVAKCNCIIIIIKYWLELAYWLDIYWLWFRVSKGFLLSIQWRIVTVILLTFVCKVWERNFYVFNFGVVEKGVSLAPTYPQLRWGNQTYVVLPELDVG